MAILTSLLEGLVATFRDVLPIVLVIGFFQGVLLRKRVQNPLRLVVGLVCVLLGISLFLLGLELALFPLGETMARQLTSAQFIQSQLGEQLATGHWQEYFWVYIFSAAIGFSTTLAEPALLAIAIKANAASGGAIRVGGLRVAVAVGVALGLALGSYRIVVGDPLPYYIITIYVIVLVQTMFAPKSMIPLAYDTGGVTTSTVTVPLVAALGLGLAQNVPGRNIMIDGFGLIAFASVFPMMTVLAYAQVSAWIDKGKKDGV
ncbi:DUF1538 domain-containing protein [Alginatibacterium sediminis]|uniref:DUF1538 domain-containing protein n=1 Tax=Alginatibacterium sediminis TaxID=2164068 RepID=A0A420E9Z2_9ALTE|nr:DUF1538 domain-containing protein [Alginatibacterium sediminis]RKF17498.1 DUF1538 domain-containing protein [Alginatibacterium sediminis]